MELPGSLRRESERRSTLSDERLLAALDGEGCQPPVSTMVCEGPEFLATGPFHEISLGHIGICGAAQAPLALESSR